MKHLQFTISVCLIKIKTGNCFPKILLPFGCRHHYLNRLKTIRIDKQPLFTIGRGIDEPFLVYFLFCEIST